MRCCQVLQRPEFGGSGSWDRLGGVLAPGAGVRAFSAAIDPTDSRSVGVQGFASESLGARKLVGAFPSGSLRAPLGPPEGESSASDSTTDTPPNVLRAKRATTSPARNSPAP